MKLAVFLKIIGIYYDVPEKVLLSRFIIIRKAAHKLILQKRKYGSINGLSLSFSENRTNISADLRAYAAKELISDYIQQ